jgi:hypothetical protein
LAERVMRFPWPPGFPPVFIHACWDPVENGLPIIHRHPDYEAAKTQQNAKAALAVCDAMARYETLDGLYDACFGDDTPLVVAPALTIPETQNALARGYGRWLAHEMGWESDDNIFKAKALSRDRMGAWFRLVNQPTFYGTVQAGRRYVIADDVCSMGGTIASLRAFIDSQGGHVIAATALASKDGSHVPISLAPHTLNRLTQHHDGGFGELCEQELGYAPDCLTEAEGDFCLGCSSPERFRAGVDGARHPQSG